MSKALLIIAGAGVAGYALYASGKFPAFNAAVVSAETAASHILPQSFWGAVNPAKAANAAAIKAASGGQVVPILGAGETVTTNIYEALLRANMPLVQPWARSHLGWAAAIAKVENAGQNPAAIGDNGQAFGLYQVHLPTAQTCFNAGYQAYDATEATLLTEAGSVYFGTAEMDRLGKMGKSQEWVIQAYNGGAGWESQSPSYVKARNAYLVRVQKAFVALYGKDMA